MQISNATFLCGIAKMNDFPQLNLPEIAFIGRSNVGKSSLINNIVLRKNLARTSSAPGKTREINFFSVNEQWILVDMPGLGYATIGKQHREKWAELNYYYLKNRNNNLKFVCVLIDSRHDPMKTDIALIEYLENINRKYLIILTKCDKISKQAITDRKEQVETLTSLCNNCIEVLPYSSVSDIGRNELLGIIRKRLID